MILGSSCLSAGCSIRVNPLECSTSQPTSPACFLNEPTYRNSYRVPIS